MKNLLHAFFSFCLFSLICAGTIAAQVLTTSPTGGASVPAWNATVFPSSKNSTTPRNKAEFTPLSADTLINYFSATTPIHNWSAPFTFNNNSEVFYGPAERFNLAAGQGSLDSLHITFDGLQGDSIYIWIYPDTLVQVSATQSYHFANIYDPNVPPLSKTVVYIGNINTQGSLQLTVKYASVAVPKDFHVVVEPRIVANGTQLTPTSSFVLRGDSEATRTRTADNTHSTFLDLHLTTPLTFSNWVVDSFFIFTGDAAPLFSNFDIQTFVSAPSPTLSLSSSSHDFGNVVIGSSLSTFGFGLTNHGASDVTITDVSISPAGTDFTAPFPLPGFLLKAGKSTTVSAGFAPTSEGLQSATVTLTMDDGTTLQIALSGTGVASGVSPIAQLDPALTIFPNPAVSSFQIKSGVAVSSIELLDILGRAVLSQKLNAGVTLDVSGLEPGRYEAVVHTEKGIVSAPVLIQH